PRTARSGPGRPVMPRWCSAGRSGARSPTATASAWIEAGRERAIARAGAFAADEGCLRMRMCRQYVVCVMEDAMVIFPRRVRWVDVNDCVFEVRQMVQQLMPYLDRDRVALRHREGGTHGHIDFGVQAMAEPTGAHLRDRFDALDMCHAVPELVYNARVAPIQQASENQGADRHTMRPIAAVMSNPTIGSTIG